MAPRIYLAGPDLFYPDAQARYDRLRLVCAQHDLHGIAPEDAQIGIAIEPTRECAQRIYRADIRLLRSCDAVLANITPHHGEEPDSGTAYELGFAAALHLPVVAYCLDGLDTRTRTLRSGHLLDADGRDDRGHLVENFGLHANLMLCAEHATFDTIEQAVQALADQMRSATRA